MTENKFHFSLFRSPLHTNIFLLELALALALDQQASKRKERTATSMGIY